MNLLACRDCIRILLVYVRVAITASVPVLFFAGQNKGGQFMSPVDSAIGTGATTESQSIVEDTDDLDHLPDDMPPPNTTIVPSQGMVQNSNQMGQNHVSPYSGLQNFHEQPGLGK